MHLNGFVMDLTNLLFDHGVKMKHFAKVFDGILLIFIMIQSTNKMQYMIYSFTCCYPKANCSIDERNNESIEYY